MLVLFETAAGFAIFKLLDEKKLQQVDNLFQDFETPEEASKVVQLQEFKKFVDSAEALQAGVALNEGKLCKPLKKLLKKVFAEEAHEQLVVWDSKLGSSIKDKLGVQCVSNNNVSELMRCIKSQVEGLIPGLQEKELSAMALGLGHNLARYKLKFSPDKVDTMIVQAINLLDDIDKELNNYMMRCREWYGWHFPELSKILTDSQAYVRTVLRMGTREKAVNSDFSDILPEEVEEKVKESAEVSMGTEISEADILNISCLCQQILELSEYRAQLSEYLTNRMGAIAPNLTILVGELVGARLIAHAGTLMNLAKHPASTIQILGAEKALFRALKDRHATPKYGLLYHAQLVTHASSKNKGKISRMLAAKAALAVRYDALGEETTTEMGIKNRAKLTSRMSMLEQGYTQRISGKGMSMARAEKYQGVSEVKQYKNAADSTMESSSKRKLGDIHDSSVDPKPKRIKVEMIEDEDKAAEPFTNTEKVKEEPEGNAPVASGSDQKKKKKKKKKQQEEGDVMMETQQQPEETPAEESFTITKKVKEEPEGNAPVASGSDQKKKKKKKKQQEEGVVMMETQQQPEETPAEGAQEEAGGEKKKKKKNKNKYRPSE